MFSFALQVNGHEIWVEIVQTTAKPCVMITIVGAARMADTIITPDEATQVRDALTAAIELARKTEAGEV